MRSKLAPPLTLTLALVGLLVLVPGAASNAAPNAWDAPITISTAGENAFDPQLVTDGTTITATWRRFDGTNFLVQTSSSTDGGTTWSEPVNLSTAGQDAFDPQLVTDGTTITATWRRFDGTNEIIQTSSSTDGGTTWSEPVNLSTAGQDAFEPQLVTDGTTITATWTRFDGTNFLVQTSSSTDGGTTWSEPVNLSTAGQDAFGPQLVTDGTTITATWTRSDGTNFLVQTSSSTDGGTTWSEPVNLSTAGQDASGPQLVTDGTTITATWTRFDGGNFRTQVSSFTPVAPVAPAPELAATGLGDPTTTLGVLALILMLGGITVLGARTMTQRTAQHLSPRP